VSFVPQKMNSPQKSFRKVYKAFTAESTMMKRKVGTTRARIADLRSAGQEHEQKVTKYRPFSWSINLYLKKDE
jgi:aminoglycoside N3'-acetyltransferase